MNTEALARIDAAITEAEAQIRHEPGCFECDRWRAQVDILREARALIPEPPTEHQAIWADTYLCSICKQRITLNWVNDEHGTWVHLTGDSDA